MCIDMRREGLYGYPEKLNPVAEKTIFDMLTCIWWPKPRIDIEPMFWINDADHRSYYYELTMLTTVHIIKISYRTLSFGKVLLYVVD